MILRERALALFESLKEPAIHAVSHLEDKIRQLEHLEDHEVHAVIDELENIAQNVPVLITHIGGELG